MILIGRKKHDVKVHLATSLMMEYLKPLVIKPRRDSTQFLDDNIPLVTYVLDEAKRMGFKLTHEQLRLASISYRRCLMHRHTILDGNTQKEQQEVITVYNRDNEKFTADIENYYINDRGLLSIELIKGERVIFAHGQWVQFYITYETVHTQTNKQEFNL